MAAQHYLMARDHHVELRSNSDSARRSTEPHETTEPASTTAGYRGFCGESADRVELLTPAVILVDGMAIPEQERDAVLAR